MQTQFADTADAPRTSSHLGTALAVAGVAAVATLAAARPARAAITPALTFNDIPGTGDIKVLNYALALEALEADLYRQALGRLTTGVTDAAGTVIVPGLGLSNSEVDVRYVREFATVEAQHRDFLNSALGASSIINTTNGALRNATFDFGITATTTRQTIVETLYTVENLGVQAYLGAIQFFATKTYLLAAGGIQATEARHTAIIAIVFNQLLAAGTFTGTPKETAPLVGETVTINGTTNTAGIDSTAAPDAVLQVASRFIVLPAS